MNSTTYTDKQMWVRLIINCMRDEPLNLMMNYIRNNQNWFANLLNLLVSLENVFVDPHRVADKCSTLIQWS